LESGRKTHGHKKVKNEKETDLQGFSIKTKEDVSPKKLPKKEKALMDKRTVIGYQRARIRPLFRKGKIMKLSRRVREILSWYEGETPGTKANLARMLMAGRLSGTGRMVILPVDQGFEHGPARSFAVNPPAYDPHYHYQLAIDAGLNAYAAPLGSLAAGADTFAGAIPTILKLNNANSLSRQKEMADQSVNASVDDALRLGCAAIGFTIYPGSDSMYNQYEEFRALSAEAKAKGLAVVLWSYPRGGAVTKDGETAFDVIAYAAHMAALLGANVIKVKMPSDFLEQKEAQKVYEEKKIPRATAVDRVRHVMQSAFNGKRLVVFSGGATKGADSVISDARAIMEGGGNGSIIGRNSFQRPREDALKLLDQIIEIYKGK
jgi:fructose-bisphosphate aldolase, class I